MSHLLNNIRRTDRKQQVHRRSSHGFVPRHGCLPTVAADFEDSAPGPPSHRWGSDFERNVAKDYYETKSNRVKFCREELARMRPDSIHQEFAVQLEFALTVDLGEHITRATYYLLEGDDMLLPVAYEVIIRVCMGLALTRRADDTFDRPYLPNADALIRGYCKDNVAMKTQLEE